MDDHPLTDTQVEPGLFVRAIHVGDIAPNPWNPNQMSDRAFEAEVESILRFGFIDPVTVMWAPPGEAQPFRIVDGEHRWRALRLILDKPPTKTPMHPSLAPLVEHQSIPAIVLDVSEEQAKKLTIVLNETRGKAQPDKLAALLADLAQDTTLDDLRQALPYETCELEALLKSVSFDPEQAAREARERVENGQGQGDLGEPPAEQWVTVKARMPASAYDVLQQAEALVRDASDLHDNREVAWGQVLEALAADYLAMPREEANDGE